MSSRKSLKRRLRIWRWRVLRFFLVGVVSRVFIIFTAVIPVLSLVVDSSRMDREMFAYRATSLCLPGIVAVFAVLNIVIAIDPSIALEIAIMSVSLVFEVPAFRKAQEAGCYRVVCGVSKRRHPINICFMRYICKKRINVCN